MILTDINEIRVARMLTLRKGLQLEIKGLRHSGRSFYSIIKKEFGLFGTRSRVLKQFEQLIPNFDEITQKKETL